MSDEQPWQEIEERQLNLWALAGMVVATLVAMVSLFVVPALEGSVFTLVEAFVLLCIIEGGCALVVVGFLSKLYTEREYEEA